MTNIMNKIKNRYLIQELSNEVIRNYLLKIFEIRQNTLIKIKNKSKSFTEKTIIKQTMNGLYGYFGVLISNCHLNNCNSTLKELIIDIKKTRKLMSKIYMWI